MGTSFSYANSSGPEERLSQLQRQVNEIGKGFPLGDKEIIRLARCHTLLKHLQKAVPDTSLKHYSFIDFESSNVSFLTHWYLLSSSLPPPCLRRQDETQVIYKNLYHVDANLLQHAPSSPFLVPPPKMQELKCLIMEQIETNILPLQFGRKLQQVAFTHATTPPSIPHASNNITQEEVTKLQFQSFLEGLSSSSRRGSRKSSTTLFYCCCSNSNLARNSSIGNQKANASQLVDLAYRLSLAARVLSYAAVSLKKVTNLDDFDRNGRELDELSNYAGSFYPQTGGNTGMTQSLLDYVKKHNHNGIGGGGAFGGGYSTDLSYNTSTPPTKDGGVNPEGKEGDADMVPLDLFLEWTESHAPCLSASLETFIHYVFFSDQPYPSSKTEFMFPNLKGQQSAFFSNSLAKTDKNAPTKASLSSPLLFTFASISPSLQGAWHRLFTSDSDGLSFNRLLNSLLGYSGPTLLIIRESSQGGIFGAFTSTVWKEDKDFYGNTDCFLYQLHPTLVLCRPRCTGTNSHGTRSSSSNYMYCNSFRRSRGYDGLAHGIGFGGTTEKPRLFIAETLDGCMASSADMTFQAGPLLPPRGELDTDDSPFAMKSPGSKYFDVDSLEVWGVGGDDVVSNALGNRSKQREIVAANIRKARKVDKAQFLDDFKSGLIESKAFQHREQIQGREGDCGLEDGEDDAKYEYEK